MEFPVSIGKIRFYIQDTGIGIKQEELEKIFLPFEQVGSKRHSVEGTGLGLAISQRIIHMMGSTIQVTSFLGEGSTFWFDVELACVDDDVNSSLHTSTIIGYKGIRRRILVVDDRWDNRSVIVNMLEPPGFECIEASDDRVSADIHEGIDSTLMILSHRLEANETRPEIQIIKNYSSIPKIPCYLGQLNQVFMNILANAIDSFEEANQNSAYTEIVKNPNIITILTKTNQQQMIISIKDNGCGMAPSIKKRIFDHLYTTKAIGKGTGLGLSICKQIIESRHSGQLTVESELGKGSVFTIILPIL